MLTEALRGQYEWDHAERDQMLFTGAIIPRASEGDIPKLTLSDRASEN